MRLKGRSGALLAASFESGQADPPMMDQITGRS
jgi:hypothetical protein